jgi:hypothetical protein
MKRINQHNAERRCGTLRSTHLRRSGGLPCSQSVSTSWQRCGEGY